MLIGSESCLLTAEKNLDENWMKISKCIENATANLLKFRMKKEWMTEYLSSLIEKKTEALRKWKETREEATEESTERSRNEEEKEYKNQ